MESTQVSYAFFISRPLQWAVSSLIQISDVKFIFFRINVEGQSVAHVHVHLLPRKAADFKVSDEVYEELEKQDLDNAFDPSRPRPYRTIEEMATESTVLRLELYALLERYMLPSAYITYLICCFPAISPTLSKIFSLHFSSDLCFLKIILATDEITYPTNSNCRALGTTKKHDHGRHISDSVNNWVHTPVSGRYCKTLWMDEENVVQLTASDQENIELSLLPTFTL